MKMSQEKKKTLNWGGRGGGGGGGGEYQELYYGINFVHGVNFSVSPPSCCGTNNLYLMW